MIDETLDVKEVILNGVDPLVSTAPSCAQIHGTVKHCSLWLRAVNGLVGDYSRLLLFYLWANDSYTSFITLHCLSTILHGTCACFYCERMSMSGGYASFVIIRLSHKWNCVWKLPVTAVISCLCTFSLPLCKADQYYQHIHSFYKHNFDLESVTYEIIVRKIEFSFLNGTVY